MADFGLNYDLRNLRGGAALERRFAAISSPALAQKFMQDLGGLALRYQKQYLYTQAVTRRTGHSGQLITLRGVTETSVTTVAEGTAAWADTGTRPHDITPKAARVLAWATSSSKGFRLTGRPSSAKGNRVAYAYAMRVHHPGTKPHPYMVRGAQEALKQANLLDRITAAWNGAA